MNKNKKGPTITKQAPNKDQTKTKLGPNEQQPRISKDKQRQTRNNTLTNKGKQG